MNHSIFIPMVIMLVFASSPGAVAHVSSQQRYNDGYSSGQEYAACDYSNCDESKHGYDTGCPTDKKHTYEFCNGYSLGYATRWHSLAGETTTQQQSQAQAQDGSNVHIDGNRNNVIIAPRQSQESSNSESNSQSLDDTEDNNYR